MFVVRRVFRNQNYLTNYISTSTIVRCEEPKNTEKVEGQKRGKKQKEESKQRTVKKAQDIDEFDILKDLRPGKKEKPSKSTSTLFSTWKSSVNKVASELGGDKEQTEKDLLDYVMSLEIRKKPLNHQEFEELNEIERKTGRHKSPEINFMGDKSEKFMRTSRHPSIERKKVFHPSIMDEEDKVKLKIWDDLNAAELAASAKIAPRNHFEELITWTNEGKLWTFPIDNDEGREEEAATNFTEHIFLEKHLEPWCPKKGPLRKFMQMVLIGLSKNHYLSVREKKEHIMWFKEYFERKKKLLQELGAVGPVKIDASPEAEKS